jgi:hypothetical protein
VYALFSLMTYEDWPDSLVPFLDDGSIRYGIIIFLYSYVGIINYVLMQVFVAVLLESFFSDLSAAEVRSVRENRVLNDLDPLMEILHRHFNTDADLSSRIAGYWNIFDCDGNGSISFKQFISGLKKLPLSKRIEITEKKLEEMTRGVLTPNQQLEGKLDPGTFDRLMRQELFAFAQRNVAVSMRPQHLGEIERSFGWRKNVSLPLARLILQTEHMLGAFKVVLLARQGSSSLHRERSSIAFAGNDEGGGGDCMGTGHAAARNHLVQPSASRVGSSPVGLANTSEVSDDFRVHPLHGREAVDKWAHDHFKFSHGSDLALGSARALRSDPLVDVIEYRDNVSGRGQENGGTGEGELGMRMASVIQQLSRMEAREEERARQRSLEFIAVRRQLNALCTLHAGSSRQGAANVPAAPEQHAGGDAAPHDLHADSKHVPRQSGDTAAESMLLQPPPVISSFTSVLQNPPPGLQPVPRQVPSCLLVCTTEHTEVRAGTPDSLRQMAASAS